MINTNFNNIEYRKLKPEEAKKYRRLRLESLEKYPNSFGSKYSEGKKKTKYHLRNL